MFFLFEAVAFALFGSSLSYSFVYDDHPKIVENQALNSVRGVVNTFLDPSNQSANPVLNHHTFRPLYVLLMAIEHAAFGEQASGYRAINIFLHGLNALLVACIASSLFGLGTAAMLVAGLAFLVHPTNVESVVWVVEQSNVLCAALIFSATLYWIRFIRSGRTRELVCTTLLFVPALLIRENAVVFPAIAAGLAFHFRRQNEVDRVPTKALTMLAALSLVFLVLRLVVLKQMGQSEHPSFLAHISVAGSALTAALKTLLVPFPLTIHHSYEPNLIWIPALALFALLTWFARKDQRWLLCVALYLIFWAPTSHMIPIAAFFSERFLYMPLLGFALLQALLWSKPGAVRWTGATKKMIVTLNVIFVALTFQALPVWKNDVTLWTHASHVTPTSWLVWFNLAESEKIVTGPDYIHDKSTLERIKANLITALRCGLPSHLAADIFLELSETARYLGDPDGAKTFAQRAAALNPSSEHQ